MLLKGPENIHQLIPDEEAAEIVRMVFTMAAEGKKKPEIARYEVYLGKTVWNKTRREAVGSKQQVKNDRSKWIIMERMHEPLVTKELYRKDYENTADRILEIEERLPELKDEVMQK